MASGYHKVRVSGTIEFLIREFTFERIRDGKRKYYSFTVKTESQLDMLFDDNGNVKYYKIIKFRSEYGGVVGVVVTKIVVNDNYLNKYKSVKYIFDEVIPSSHFNLRRI